MGDRKGCWRVIKLKEIVYMVSQTIYFTNMLSFLPRIRAIIIPTRSWPASYICHCCMPISESLWKIFSSTERHCQPIIYSVCLFFFCLSLMIVEILLAFMTDPWQTHFFLFGGDYEVFRTGLFDNILVLLPFLWVLHRWLVWFGSISFLIIEYCNSLFNIQDSQVYRKIIPRVYTGIAWLLFFLILFLWILYGGNGRIMLLYRQLFFSLIILWRNKYGILFSYGLYIEECWWRHRPKY